MTAFIGIKPGQWVLAFDQPYFWPGSDMPEWLSRFTTWGGGWDGRSAKEIFIVHQAVKVMPKTYLAQDWRRKSSVGQTCRYYRETVVQAFDTEAEAISLRDRFHAIGVKTTQDIEAEAERLIKSYAEKRESQALKEIHRLLPQHFGRQS